ncbi:hemolymph lipopolysaccharide-binding protein-like [Periplaneta americana]|uniref:hemolymph lipopolysaccharide-binding protein-like n=1 Tax=Periplaneta americana TaxID=6978 RepID=UPI0037E80850
MLVRAILFCVGLCVCTSKSLQCNMSRASAYQLSITSRRNESGIWVAQVSLDHGPSDEYDGIWHVDVDHTTTKCERSETVHLVATVTAPLMKPSPNYEYLPELGYYKFHPITVDWSVARETCMKEGAYLMVLNSEKEFQAIKKIWDRQPKLTTDWRNDFIHVGLTDHETEGQFYSIFGEHVNSTGYAKWKAGEPNSGNTANCAGVQRSGDFYDSNCSNKLGFFCKQQLQ